MKTELNINQTKGDEMNWSEYDAAAKWCAQRGLCGIVGDRLPPAISLDVLKEINHHPDEFEQRVRDTAYAIAMERVTNQGG